MIPNTDNDEVRPSAGHGSSIGLERYRLIKAAFAHVQQSIRNGYYLEAITVLESILTDRLGSMVHGTLGHEVTQRLTLGGLVNLAKKGPLITQREQAKSLPARHATLPGDILGFLTGPLSRWWGMRNEALHGMAKLHHVGDATFAERYARVSAAALEGVRILLQLDAYDQQERENNGAGFSATYPEALSLDPEVTELIAKSVEPASQGGVGAEESGRRPIAGSPRREAGFLE
jgi:hypothetical protein